MDFGVSPITNTIYAGKSKVYKDGISEWVGVKEDVTDQVIKVVFEWFIHNHKQNEPSEAFEITYASTNYKLTMEHNN